MKFFLFIASCAFFILFMGKISFGQFVVSAEIRPRFEYHYGYKRIPDKDSDPAIFVSQRTRFNIAYQASKFNIAFSIQDARVWGDESIITSTGLFGDPASIDLKEGWLELFLTKDIKIKMGRQFLIYDDQRLIGSRNWNQLALAYDALLLTIQKSELQFSVCGSWNSGKENIFGNEYPADRIKTLNFIYLKNNFNEKINLSLIAIASGYQKSDTSKVIYLRGTYGANLIFHNKKYELSASAYYQNGKNKTGKDVRAYLISAKATYNLAKSAVSCGIDYISGQDTTISDPSYHEKDHLFDILYGARHRFYGHMDYFSNMPKSTAGAGLFDIYIKFLYQPWEKQCFGLDLHYFSLNAMIIDPNFIDVNPIQTLGKTLGGELDFYYKYMFSKIINVQAGFSLFSPTETMEIINGPGSGNSTFPYCAWIMVTAKPTLFKQK